MLKLVWKEMKRSWFFHLLLLIQITAVFLVMISMVSTIVSRFHYYNPLAKLLDTKGYYYNMNYMTNPMDGRYLVYEDEQLENSLSKAETIYSTYRIIVRCKKIPDMELCLAYNQNMAELYQPAMQEGIWLNEAKETDSGMIPGVIGSNSSGIQVGDVLEIENGYVNEKEEQPHISIKVVGIIAEDEKVLLGSEEYEKDYRDIYLSCENDAENTPELFLRSEDFEQYEDFMNAQLAGALFISYQDSITEEEFKENQTIMNENADYIESMEFSELKEGSLNYIGEQIYTLFPIIIGVLVLTLTGAMSVNAISIKKQMRNFSIYYICGLQWRKCILINIILLLMQVLLAGILSVSILEILKGLGLLEYTIIEFGGLQLLSCSTVGILYIVLSLLLPLQILHKSTPNEVLKTN